MASADYEGTEQETFIQHPDAARYNIIGTFASSHEADRALVELHRAGFTNADLRVLARPDDAVVSGYGMTVDDRKVVGSTVRWSALGIGAGAVLGALLGIGVMAIPAFQSAIGVHVSGSSFLLAALFGAIFGSVIGVAGGIFGLSGRRAGVSTFDNQEAKGALMLGIHTEDDEHARAATGVLHATGAANVEQRSGGRAVA